MFKLFLKLLCLAPVLGLIVLCNYFVDPANLFQEGKYERGIASLLLQGKNVANISNYDERLLQKYYIDGLERKDDVVVIGSSRVMQIRSEIFLNKRMFNNSVSGAVIQDDLAIYQMYRRKRIVPSVLILGLDPWLLNENNGETRWKSVGNYYEEIDRVISPQATGTGRTFSYDLPIEKYEELLSITYFQESLKKLFAGSHKQEAFFATNNSLEDCPVKLVDGSLNYDRKYRTRNTEEVRKEAISYASQDPVYSLGRFTRLDRSAVQKLDAFIDLLKKDGVRVILFLPPYHPKTYEMLIRNPKYRIIGDVEQRFRQLAGKHKVTILGSFNPGNVSLGEDDFYDGMHAKASGLNKIFVRGSYGM